MKHSSGTLLYRQGTDGLEVLLVHPSGVYNRRSPWGIPKGMIDGEETPEQAARRETMEETSVIAAELADLGHVDYTRSRKRVYCFAGPHRRTPRRAAPRGRSIRWCGCLSTERGR